LGRPRKSLQELKLSGTYQQNKKRYEAVASAPPAKPLGRVPSYLTKEEKACWKEISSDLALAFGDRLALEVAAKLLAKSRVEVLKPSTLNNLSKQLDRLKAKGQQATVVEVDSAPESGPCDWEEFFALCDREDAEEARIRAEMDRRRDIGPQGNQTQQEWERWCWWDTVRSEFEKGTK
jgi:hypothetical protein